MRLIDADALHYSRVQIFHGFNEDGTPCIGGYNAVVMSAEIKDAPTIEARPVVRGEWIEKPHTDGFGGHYFLYHCSRCDTPYAKKRNFCNECGADMRPKEESEDAGN